MDNDVILRTNELDNAIDYLKKSGYYYNSKGDSHWFKWLMISLHGALYGFGICAIKGTNSDRVIEIKLKPSKFEKRKQEVVELYKDEYGIDLEDDLLMESITKYQVGQLMGIWEVLDCCENEDYMMQFTFSKLLKLTEKQRRAINKLILYRNDFIHFKPKDISVITQSEEWIIEEVVSVIEFLALESRNVFYRGNHTIDKVEKLLKAF
ncbi:hypothetical protein AKG34_13440 [Peribacillus butanolivorans]|uniref:hypothetical protein n=1 Tax=Peribacillus butanolivorans TaxID=421767 RepID=UPI0006A703D0|nr:hypothetical protein [Peribacillus butanolivorans]KON69650.1 hypothetical protein AKG34_13440 [Peribacillus butanolivorans]